MHKSLTTPEQDSSGSICCHFHKQAADSRSHIRPASRCGHGTPKQHWDNATSPLPFTAIHGREYRHLESLKVISLDNPEDKPMIDDTVGRLCDARIKGHIVTFPVEQLEDAKGTPNRQLIDDDCC